MTWRPAVVEAWSEVGVTVTAQPVRLARHSAPPFPDGSRGRVLVVDDDRDVLTALMRALRRSGFDVDGARRGLDAVAMVTGGNYDAVVSDISMPDIDGIELLRRLRAHDLDLPVILATGAPTLETAIQAVELGAMRYLTKPVGLQTLSKAVARGVRWRRICKLRRELGDLDDAALRISDIVGLQVRFQSALEKLYIEFQPIVSWSQRKIVGYEALVRSNETDLARPEALFDAAERLDRLHDLGRSIRTLVTNACESAPMDLLLFVNLHTRDLLDDSLYDDRSSLSSLADRVVLEVTERAKLEQVNDIPRRITTLREQGFRIAIDDIGAGYSGLNSFAQLEPDVVKLDMLLVRNVDQRPTQQKLIRSLTSLCSDLDMRVVAEGIETPAERDTLIGLGCDWLQGYLFARPSALFASAQFSAC